MNRLRRTIHVLGAAVLAVGVVTFASPVAGAGTTGSVTVRRVDASAFPAVKVDVTVQGAAVTPQGFGIKENGKTVKGLAVATLAGAHSLTGTVLLIDTAATMNDANKLGDVQASAIKFIGAKSPTDLMAVVAYGGAPRVVQDFTADPVALSSAISRLAVGGAPALFAGVRMAATLLMGRPDLLANLVVVGDSGNSGKLATGTNAVADLKASKALTFSVGLGFGTDIQDLSTLSQLAAAGSGHYLEARDAAGVVAAFTSIQASLANQFELSYLSTGKKGSLGLTVSLAGLHADALVVPGQVAVGAATNPPAVTLHGAPGPLSGKLGLLLIALMVLAAAGLLTYAVIALVTREDNALVTALRPYNDGSSGDVGEDEDRDGSYVQTALIQRAVDSTAKFAKDRGLLDVTEAKLEQANLALRPAEALFFYGVGVLLLTVLAVFSKGLIIGLIVGAMAVMAPPAILNLLVSKRLRKFNALLPDTLQLLASSLRAGFSFLQGVEAVSQEVDEPMGGELRRVMIEAQLGRPVEEALDDCALRVKSPDFDWAVMAVKIQREVGGNLAELLQTVSVTMVERERLRRDVRSLTAEGRMSAIILGCLPPGLGLFLFTSNPGYMRPLIHDTVGEILLGVAFVAMIAGFAWMQKTIKIEV